MKRNPLIEKAIKICGNQTALAKACGGNVKQQNVQQWMYMKRLPAERAVQIEKATGGKVTKAELRPDLFLEDMPANRRSTERRAEPTQPHGEHPCPAPCPHCQA